MSLDLPTMMLAGSFVAMMCGALLAVTWWQHREVKALLWWSGGHLALGLAVVTLAVSYVVAGPWLFPVGLAMLLAGPALIWSGTRSFYGKEPGLTVHACAALIWTLAVVTLGVHGASTTPVLHALLIIAYGGATIRELARRDETVLWASRPLIVLFGVNMVVYALSVPDALNGSLSGSEPPSLNSLFGLIHFESIIYAIGTTLFFVAMMKERIELRQRRDAETDELTRLPNRRAFLAGAERLKERHQRDGQPFAVVAFDLDRFKSINDGFGHAVGDRTLRLFADVARESLRQGDLISRIGGEEFAALFPGADDQAGWLMAERIRRAFAEAGLAVEGHALGATVSAGVAVAHDGETLTELMERADMALYQAKLNGRDRVERDGGQGRTNPYPRLVKVA